MMGLILSWECDMENQSKIHSNSVVNIIIMGYNQVLNDIKSPA